MKKKQRPPEDTGKWLTTYSDTITLLMCFFVLLYSISSVDAAKWEIVVRSFNPNASATSQIVTDQSANAGDFDVEGATEPAIVDDFDELYYALKKEVDEQQLQSDVEITKGDGFTFITFRNNIFFDGDSYVLKENGKQVLDSLANIIKGSSKTIGEVQVLGHTSQARPNEQNDVRFDRFLASNRATEVLTYIQMKDVIEPSKLVASSYGQFRPVSPFDTTENRAKNRRVEIVITKNDAVTRALDEYYAEVYE